LNRKAVAEALEAAHKKNHRDPAANINQTRDGNVKVLDFGLAKVGDAAKATLNPRPQPLL
jgi:serine/threonine protein kinase